MCVLRNWERPARAYRDQTNHPIRPLEIKEQYERQLSDLQQAYGEAMLELRARTRLCHRWPRRQMSAGPRTCAGCGLDVTVGVRSPW